MPATPEIVHPVAVEDLSSWRRRIARTFLHDPDVESGARREEGMALEWDPERTWGARDRGQWVATLRTLDRTVTVPGADGATEVVAADGLTAVTVSPTHRRRGLLTAMLEASLAAARDRGDPLSMLVAAEYPIYGRFGYAPATWGARRVLHRSRPGATVSGDVGRVRQVELDEFVAVAPAAFAAARRGRSGQVDRDGRWWDRTLGVNGYPRVEERPVNLLVHDGDDGVDGLLAWTASGEGGLLPPLPTARAWGGPVASTADAHRDLWAYLSGIDGVDAVDVVTALDDPVAWLLPNARALVTTEVVDELWVKLLDVPAVLSARRYAVPGELVLEVTDPTPASVAGRYRLLSDPGGPIAATCEPTRAAPDLTVAQAALASAYLGGVSLRAQAIAGTVAEHRRGALERADVMFATALQPLNWTGF